ncbi:MAG: hypothetical protein M0Z79_02660 [Nitrospiraceae bacterium]|nr:hypothetical protein [Nitrospiraceae bacterium]
MRFDYHIKMLRGFRVSGRARQACVAALVRVFGFCAGLAVMLTCFSAGAAPSHLDIGKNPAGCSGCHKGHGKRGTAMLKVEKKDYCFTCHGASGQYFRPRMDIATVLMKRSHHPVVETSLYHDAAEELPEKNSSTPRHVACQDCHNVHDSEPDKPMKRTKGHRRGDREKESTEEYEVCYRCHAESANLPSGNKNIADQFDMNNASYHPIEAMGKSSRVPSLMPPYNVASRITCSGCHGNSDSSGPRGPHGSDFEYMLKSQYIQGETAESQSAYALCYNCHNRQNILGDASFQKHNFHVVFRHAPCAACHVSHGSRQNSHLISFSAAFVDPAPSPTYSPSLAGKPMCYLTCHVGGVAVPHNSNFYKKKKWPQ